MKVSVIITTYNWPEALTLVLQSLLKQSRKPYEIIVADDGSKEETAIAVKKILGPSNIRWLHVRQEDIQIRQARVKNLGVKYSSGDYFIFIDHDVILHPDFVLDHINAAEKEVILQGKRVFLKGEYTRNLFLKNNQFTLPSPFTLGLENRKNAFRSPWLAKLFARKKKFQTALRGCNVSMQKEDFFKVDGYDEVFDLTWGHEDSDICYRLFFNNVRIRNLWFTALQYHIDHKVIKNCKKDVLDIELEKVIRERRKRAIKGYSRMSSEGKVVDSSS